MEKSLVLKHTNNKVIDKNLNISYSYRDYLKKEHST